MKKYSKKQIVHCILVTACMFIVSGVWIAISTKNDLEPFFNDARSRLEEKYQRTVQIDRYIWNYRNAAAVRVRFADEPEVEFYAWENNDTYFEAYLAWDATRMLKGAFPDFTVRADVYLPGGDAKGDADRLRFYKENGRAASWQDAECRDNINAIFLRSDTAFSKAESLKIMDEIARIFGSHVYDTDVRFSGANTDFYYRFGVDGTVHFVRETEK